MAEFPTTAHHIREGHHLDPGPYALDLYRLLNIVLAAKRIAELSIDSPSISFLQDRYLESEVIRILIAASTAIRFWFDQHGKATRGLKTNCGTVWPQWKPGAKREVLTLREACNKIIHADKIHYDNVVANGPKNPDEEGRYIRPFLYLYGRKDGQDWRAKLSIVDFVKWGIAAFRIAGWSA
jgi:hypothetical protein